MGVQPEGLVHERVVLVVAAVHRPGAFARLPEGELATCLRPGTESLTPQTTASQVSEAARSGGARIARRLAPVLAGASGTASGRTCNPAETLAPPDSTND